MENNLVWLDMEMTGLDTTRHTILEVGVIVTDENLNILDPGIEIVLYQSETALAEMDEWNWTHHGESGLLEKVRKSTISVPTAEKMILDYLSKFTQPKLSPLCGNSIWNDRGFVRKFMPELENYLHYRVVDVSSIKELARRWYPRLKKFEKKESHRALEDISESIAELKYYREKVFRNRAK